MARERLLESVQFVGRPLPEVFAFFSDAGNLERITPAFLHFRILSPMPVAMAAGALIEYRIRLFGIPFRWESIIEAWEPGVRFVDVQRKGPYALWHHTHEFREVPGGTLVVDRVRYAMPMGFLGEIGHALFVRRSLGRIFGHRRRVIGELLGE